ncbi:MAG: permease [Chitinophagaceae bacterium]
MVVTKILTELLQMVWEIYWPLALGFILSALIRAFVSNSSITSGLGKANAKGLGMATLFGAISSSCSYAAASMSRTLIVKGASWSNAIAFMIASTNLVFEIFLVIISLLGWAFFGGEIVGGILFILAGTVFIKILLTQKSISKANQHIKKGEALINKNDPHAQPAQMGMEAPVIAAETRHDQV